MAKFIGPTPGWEQSRQFQKQLNQAQQRFFQERKKQQLAKDMTLLGQVLEPERSRLVDKRMQGVQDSDAVTHPTKTTKGGVERQSVTSELVNNLDKLNTAQGIKGAQSLLMQSFESRQAQKEQRIKQRGKTRRAQYDLREKRMDRMPEPYETRKKIEGKQVVQEEYIPGSGWQKVGAGPRWKPRQEEQKARYSKAFKKGDAWVQRNLDTGKLEEATGISEEEKQEEWGDAFKKGKHWFQKNLNTGKLKSLGKVEEPEVTTADLKKEARQEMQQIQRQRSDIKSGTNIKTRALGEDRKTVIKNLDRAYTLYNQFAQGRISHDEMLKKLGKIYKVDPEAEPQEVGGKGQSAKPKPPQQEQSIKAKAEKYSSKQDVLDDDNLSDEEALEIIEYHGWEL